MIQTQTLAVTDELRAKLLELSNLIQIHKNDRARVTELIAEHDLLMKQAIVKDYNPHEEIRWS